MFFTLIRVVCQNTLQLAEVRGRGQGISILHKGDLTSKIREAQRVLGLAERFYDDANEKIQRLANFYPSPDQLDRFFKSLYPDSEKSEKPPSQECPRQVVSDSSKLGWARMCLKLRGTAWAAFNAVTEFVDHVRSTRGVDSRDRAARRLDSAWFGSGAKLKAQAWDLALAMTDIN